MQKPYFVSLSHTTYGVVLQIFLVLTQERPTEEIRMLVDPDKYVIESFGTIENEPYLFLAILFNSIW